MVGTEVNIRLTHAYTSLGLAWGATALLEVQHYTVGKEVVKTSITKEQLGLIIESHDVLKHVDIPLAGRLRRCILEILDFQDMGVYEFDTSALDKFILLDIASEEKLEALMALK